MIESDRLRDVYISGVGAFLPGSRIGNAQMEDFIGRISGRSSVVGRRALRWNGIEGRHYALDALGQPLHSNASMCAAAARAALDDAGLDKGALGFLAAATTQGDLLVPGHASAVQAELGAGPMEVASFQSVCASALMAAKAGATFISPFIGRLDDYGMDGMDLIREIRAIYDNYDFDTEILAASIRNPAHVTAAALSGADCATIPPGVLQNGLTRFGPVAHELFKTLVG